MTKSEQRALLDRFLATYRERPYAELLSFADPAHGEHCVVKLESGEDGFVDVQGIWDDPRKGHLRIMVSVYDRGLSAFLPATDDFIVAPDGTFIGEAATPDG